MALGRSTLPLLLLAAAMLACTQQDPAAHLAAAKVALAKKDTKTATIEVKNALQLNGDLAEARLVLGKLLLKSQNAVGAEVELRKALAAGQPASEVVPELARAMQLQQQWKKLIDELGSTRLETPAAQAQLKSALASAHEALGNTAAFEAALAEALASDPHCAPAQLMKARQSARAKDLVGASASVDAVLARHPEETDAWKLKGDLLQVNGNTADALAAYTKALEQDGSNYGAQSAAVVLQLRAGRLDEAGQQLARYKAVQPPLLTRYLETQLAYAKTDLKTAREGAQQLLKAKADSPMFLQLAGAIELRLNSTMQAELYLTRALQLEPGLPLARRLLAMTHLRSGQAAKAMADLNALTNGGKQEVEPSLLALAGEIHLQNGDAQKAESYFSRALKLDPNSSEKRTALAMSRLARGDDTEAFAELESTAKADQGAVADLALISALLRKGDFARALAAVDRLEAKEPKNPRTALMRGRIHLAMKDATEARKSFEKALAVDPGSMAAASNLAALDLAERRTDDARKRFEQLLERNPQHVQAMLALAQLAEGDGDKKGEVAGWLNKSIEADPSDGEARRALVNHLLKSGDTKLALEAAQKAVSAMPNSADALDTLGRAQLAAGEVNQALSTFAKLSAAQPLSPIPHLRMASAQMAAKNQDAAEQSLRKALDIKPDLLEAQVSLVRLLVASKKFPQALDVAKTIQKQRPDAPLGYSAEGDVLAAQGRHDASAVAYRTGLQRVPKAELAIKLHMALKQSGQANEAERFVASWTKDHPKDVLFQMHLGDMALIDKDYKLAEKRYQDGLKVEPNSALLLNNLAWVSGQLGKDQEAAALAEKANLLAPRQPAFMDTWAMLLAKRNETARAQELLSRALALQPKNTSLRLNLAKVQIQSGDKAKAKAELELLLKSNETSPVHAEAQGLLKTL